MKKHGTLSPFMEGVLAFFYCVFLVVVLGIGFWFGYHAMGEYRASVLIDDAAVIDEGLAMYAKTKEVPAYPSDLREVTVARTQDHWMLRKVLIFLHRGNYDESEEIKSRFNYTPLADSEHHFTMYKLEVTLPNGQNYLSPRSTRPNS